MVKINIPYSTQSIDEDDILNVTNILKSDFLTQGPKTKEFENAICEYVGAKYATSTNSATSALHIACLSLGLGPGDHFWTSPISFVASANCGLLCGAKVDFVDINPETFNICVDSLSEKLVLAKQRNKLPKIVIPVHMTGKSCDMKKIHKLSLKYGFKIIEDASHALSSNYNNKKVGSCEYSDACVFSFHPVKIITTGEGGMVVTNKKILDKKLKLFCQHGITKDKSRFFNKSHGGWYYEQQLLGYNYRMTDLEASLGLSQLRKIKKLKIKRHEIASNYEIGFQNSKVKLPNVSKNDSLHLYVIKFQEKEFKRKHKNIFNYLRSKGIFVNLHYIPIHLQPYFKNMGFKLGDFPNSEKYYKEAISIPIFPNLNIKSQSYIIETILNIK